MRMNPRLPAVGHPYSFLVLPMPARVILGIETSNPSAWTPDAPRAPGVALANLENGTLHTLGVETIDPTTPHTDALMASIDRLCARVGVRPRDLARVCVSAGPGGYTAVRLGITTAALIAEATGAEAVPVPTALIAVHNANGEYPLAVALATKGEEAHVSLFHAPGTIARAGLMTCPDLEALNLRTLVGDAYLPTTWRAEAARLGIAMAPTVLDPEACIACGVGLAGVEPEALRPIYPREPEAVRKWRELHPPPRSGEKSPLPEVDRPGGRA
jgi:tRNA threonylcarbamoyladenosine biosynthesis protein TsaB